MRQIIEQKADVEMVKYSGVQKRKNLTLKSNKE